jgi:hypothetical protein
MRIRYHTLPTPMNKNNGIGQKLTLENNHTQQHNLGLHKYTAALEDHRQAIIREWTREMGGYLLWIIAAVGAFALGCVVWCILSAFIQVHREKKARMRLASIQVIVGGGILRVSCDGRKDLVKIRAERLSSEGGEWADIL